MAIGDQYVEHFKKVMAGYAGSQAKQLLNLEGDIKEAVGSGSPVPKIMTEISKRLKVEEDDSMVMILGKIMLANFAPQIMQSLMKAVPQLGGGPSPSTPSFLRP